MNERISDHMVWRKLVSAADEGGSGSGGVAADGALVGEPLNADQDGNADGEAGRGEGQAGEGGGVAVDEGSEGAEVAGSEGGGGVGEEGRGGCRRW